MQQGFPSTAVADLRRQLTAHPIYARVHDLDATRTFMQHHVFAVWDFMSLVKTLQQTFTSVKAPWLPPADPISARLINEIVLAEESDEDGHGGYASHFDLYCAAMNDVGADLSAIRGLLALISEGAPAAKALLAVEASPPVHGFVTTTLDLCAHGQPHEVAAAFFYGREEVIPEMFRHLIDALDTVDPRRTERLRYYLERHVVIDDGQHGPAALRLLQRRCADDPRRWQEAEAAAVRALQARLRLWDGTLDAIERQAERTSSARTRSAESAAPARAERERIPR